jgi:hypothetical protein
VGRLDSLLSIVKSISFADRRWIRQKITSLSKMGGRLGSGYLALSTHSDFLSICVFIEAVSRLLLYRQVILHGRITGIGIFTSV